ncbi:STAS/SEC14 domain-containing protein [Halalkalicoccus tibetensis]|uniref:STAS/SEC14 domain-containing protein n=1 Tax=Halalkalicoccus tibetensis TaxID=175632 RepID=A0ABD5V5R0_9EURY
MVERLPRSEGNSIGYSATDELSEGEYEEILADVEEAIEEHGSAKLLMDISGVSEPYAEFDAYEEDFGFYLRHGEDMECYAVVGDDSLIEWGTEASDLVTDTEIEFFEEDELDEAWEFVEDDSGKRRE